ncbi:hypothetical protein ACKWTF_010884 [Chironomus riparius]
MEKAIILFLIIGLTFFVCHGDSSFESSDEDELKDVEPGKPLNILDVTDDNQFIVETEAITKIFENSDLKRRKVVAVSIVGIFRKGKSFLLNYFLRYLYANFKSVNYPDNPLNNTSNWIGKNNQKLSGFQWKASTDGVTNGIIMWSDVFLCDKSTGDKLAIVLIDTQGLFDKKASTSVNSKIFALTTLISSVQIYNLHNVIQEDQLQYLQFTSDFAKLINNMDTNNGDQSSIKPFQKMILLMRDWVNFAKYPFGLRGGKKYLNEVLEITNEHQNDAKEVRKFIRSSFDDINCFLMPHPGDQIFNTDDFNGEWSKLDGKFVDQLKSLISWLFNPSNLSPKKIFNKYVTVEEYTEHLKFYFDAASSNELMNVSTIFEATMESEGNLILQKSLKVLKKNLRQNENIENPLFLKQIDEIGRNSTEAANINFKKLIESFTERDNFIKRWTEKLKDQMTKELNNWKETSMLNYERFQKIKQLSQQETAIKLEVERKKFEIEISKLTQKNSNEKLKLQAKFDAAVKQFEFNSVQIKQENEAERQNIIQQKLQDLEESRLNCERMVKNAKTSYNNEMNQIKEREEMLRAQKLRLEKEKKAQEAKLKQQLEEDNKNHELEVQKLRKKTLQIENELKRKAEENERELLKQQQRKIRVMELEFEEYKSKEKLKNIEHKIELERAKNGLHNAGLVASSNKFTPIRYTRYRRPSYED